MKTSEGITFFLHGGNFHGCNGVMSGIADSKFDSCTLSFKFRYVLNANGRTVHSHGNGISYILSVFTSHQYFRIVDTIGTDRLYGECEVQTFSGSQSTDVEVRVAKHFDVSA